MKKQSAVKTNTVYVLGMHKSGTSMAANICAELGFFPGIVPDKMPISHENVFGYYEAPEIKELNQQILDEVGYNFDYLPETKLLRDRNFLVNFQEDAEKVIIGLRKDNKKLVIKDPRISLLLPLWEPLTENNKFILVFRNPLEVAHSLNKRNKIPISQGIELNQIYNQSALENLKGKDFLMIRYEDILGDPVKQVERISKYLLLGSDSHQIKNAAKVPEIAVKHNVFTDDEFEDSDQATQRQKIFYKKLLNLYEANIKKYPLGKNNGITITQDERLKDLHDKIAFLREVIKDKQTERDKFKHDYVKCREELKRLSSYYNERINQVKKYRKEIIDLQSDKLNRLTNVEEYLRSGSLEGVKILISSHSTSRMGASRSLLTIVEYLIQKKALLHVVVPDRGDFTEKLDVLGVDYSINRFTWPVVNSPRDNVRHLARNILEDTSSFTKIINEVRPDLVYSNTIVSLASALAAKLCGLPHVWHIREVSGKSHGWKMILEDWKYYKLIGDLSDKTIFISRALEKEYAKQIPNHKRQVVYNYVNTESFENAKNVQPPDNKKVDIVIPFYNDPFTLRCLESIVKNKDQYLGEVLIVDDVSPNEELVEQVKAFADNYEYINYKRNKVNKGFVYNINKGIEMTSRDLIFLNSDTLVTKGWLSKILTAAYSDEKIGTVTPLSSNANIFSIPKPILRPGDSNEDNDPDFTAEIVEQFADDLVTDIPVGHGFCLFVKREIINKVGVFDYDTFKRGYGEETDFCLRVKRDGYRNVLAKNAYVYHKGIQSFTTEEKIERVKENSKLIHTRYPEFKQMHRDFMEKEKPLDDIRQIVKFFKNHPNAFKKQYICTLSQVVGVKGIMDVVQAVRILKDMGVDINYMAVGPVNPDFKREVDHYIKINQLEENVYFPGVFSNPFPFLVNAKVFINGSIFEAFGRTTAEAMNLEVPIVVSNSGANPELIEDKKSGLVYNTGDAADLAEKLKWIINRPLEAKKLAVVAKKRVAKISSYEKYGGGVEEQLLSSLESNFGGHPDISSITMIFDLLSDHIVPLKNYKALQDTNINDGQTIIFRIKRKMLNSSLGPYIKQLKDILR